MKKFTFITLMMILGISSVSFGKSYLCIPSQMVVLNYEDREVQIVKEDEIPLTTLKFLVKTEGNNRKMISVKTFGSDNYHCKVGEKKFNTIEFGLVLGNQSRVVIFLLVVNHIQFPTVDILKWNLI